MNVPELLIEKYDVPVPRYTSYPTVPFWGTEKPDASKWLAAVKHTFDRTNSKKGISVYIHLPYCESLCSYCACTKVITKKHSVEGEYIQALLAEWNTYLEVFGEKPILRELHLGGGTPTFFSSENLDKLISGIKSTSVVHPDHEFSFEGHPNNTTSEHLQTLYDLGFRRVSFGVQDFDPEVQRIINRIQPFEKVKEVTEKAREVGFTSVNFDLIFGLPLQQLSSVEDTFEKVGRLKPDRIAYYSYAHVPWKSNGQRLFTELDIPDKAEKRALYELGKEKLNELGYEDIGMDHFALPSDSLFQAKRNGSLHRNFMGYTTSTSDLLIGLGASSISDAENAYVQNTKSVTRYKSAALSKTPDFERGYFLTDEDLILKQVILDISCNGKLEITEEIEALINTRTFVKLKHMCFEGLIEFDEKQLRLTDLGMVFLRNVCGVFDKKLNESATRTGMFSKAI